MCRLSLFSIHLLLRYVKLIGRRMGEKGRRDEVEKQKKRKTPGRCVYDRPISLSAYTSAYPCLHDTQQR